MEPPSQIIQWDRFQTIKEECLLIHIWEDFMQEEHILDQISQLCGVDAIYVESTPPVTYRDVCCTACYRLRRIVFGQNGPESQ